MLDILLMFCFTYVFILILALIFFRKETPMTEPLFEIVSTDDDKTRPFLPWQLMPSFIVLYFGLPLRTRKGKIRMFKSESGARKAIWRERVGDYHA